MPPYLRLCVNVCLRVCVYVCVSVCMYACLHARRRVTATYRVILGVEKLLHFGDGIQSDGHRCCHCPGGRLCGGCRWCEHSRRRRRGIGCVWLRRRLRQRLVDSEMIFPNVTSLLNVRKN